MSEWLTRYAVALAQENRDRIDDCCAGQGNPTLTAPAPEFNPPAGTYADEVTVAITTTVSGATIYYTVDGSTPTTASFVYSGPLTFSADTTLKAIVTHPSLITSSVTTAAYDIEPSFTGYYGTSADVGPLTEAEILALTSFTGLTITGNYNFPAGSAVYRYFWFPAAVATPVASTGFLLNAFPYAMADNSVAGYTSGPVNGWYYANVTVNGVAGRLFRSFNPTSATNIIAVTST